MKILKPLLFIFCAVSAGAWFARDGWAEAGRQQEIAKTQEDRMKAAEKERAQLLRQEAELSAPGGQEALARQRGYMKPNEVRVPK
ncbi:hypothetical protein EON79_17190 [bacterium]|nr:MAG: hypothetical protein EON79_17190 [bacterium]